MQLRGCLGRRANLGPVDTGKAKARTELRQAFSRFADHSLIAARRLWWHGGPAGDRKGDAQGFRRQARRTQKNFADYDIGLKGAPDVDQRRGCRLHAWHFQPLIERAQCTLVAQGLGIDRRVRLQRWGWWPAPASFVEEMCRDARLLQKRRNRAPSCPQHLVSPALQLGCGMEIAAPVQMAGQLGGGKEITHGWSQSSSRWQRGCEKLYSGL